MKRKHLQVINTFIYAFLIGILLTSCNKEEGFGGNSHIKGKLIEKVYNDDYSLLLFEQAAKNEEVFIVFGNNEYLGDDVNTNFNGNFEFKYLHPGNYQVFYYSDDTLSAYDENKEVILNIELEKNETNDIGELYIIKSIDYDEGNAIIRGRVFLINYLNSTQWPNLIVKDTSLAQEQEVYISYENHIYYDDRIRTQFDGTFAFTNLIKGHYKIFLYSENPTGATEDIVISKEIDIINELEDIDLGDIYIMKL
ncbi:MAG: hypothetical protein U9R19_03715 [Bacteroidota bacterium]|nr:hypothetical protein [Bacteroidota bacterium]